MNRLVKPMDVMRPKVEFPYFKLRVLDGNDVWVEDTPYYMDLFFAKLALVELIDKCFKPKCGYIVHDRDEWHREFYHLVSWNLDGTPVFVKDFRVRDGYLWHCVKGLLFKVFVACPLRLMGKSRRQA